MSLARLGRIPTEADMAALEQQETLNLIQRQLVLMNDYMALMANTDEPPERDTLEE